MNRMTVTLTVLTLAGFKIPGIKLPDAAKAPAGVSAVPGVSVPSADEAKVRALWEKLDYTNSGNGTEADALFSSQGVSTTWNPRMHMQNLDAEWIPGWDSLQLTDETKTAIAQAKINKTWTAKCHADFAEYKASWAKIDASARPELERLKKPGNFYDRAAGLAALLAKVEKEATAEKALYPAGYAPANVGLVDEIVVAMVSLHKEGRREFALANYLGKQGIKLAEFQERGRAFAPDDVEQDLFCSGAQKNGTLKTPPLPGMAEYGKGYAAVRWPVSNERDAVIGKARAALIAQRQPALEYKATKAASLTNGELPEAADPKLYYVHASEGQSGLDQDTPFKVKSVKGSSVEIESVRSRLIPYGCVSTNKIEGVDVNGHVTYVKSCKYQKQTTTRAVTADFRELPSGLQLKPGDLVGFYGDLVERHETKVSETPSAKVTRETLKFNVRHLDEVKRGASLLVNS